MGNSGKMSAADHKLDITYLSELLTPWYGSHSSSSLLVKYVKKINADTKVVYTGSGLFRRGVGRMHSILRGWSRRDSVRSEAEMRLTILYMKNGRRKDSIYHIMNYEPHNYFFEFWKKAPKNIIGTIHQIPRQYSKKELENIRRLSSAIILYRRDIKFFEEFVGSGRVKFIHHGVDTDFFRPGDNCQRNRILYVGQHLRNTQMLYRVVTRLHQRHPELQFDLLVPEQCWDAEGLRQLAGHPAVKWHPHISDAELLRLYQESCLMLLPLRSVAACNSVNEALACGVPIVTTDVGGIRDYGGGSVYPVVDNNDDAAMVDLVERYLSEPGFRDKVSAGERRFAEEKLSWPLIAEKHIQAYKELTK